MEHTLLVWSFEVGGRAERRPAGVSRALRCAPCARARAQYFDLDGSGTIDKGELRGLLKALCIPSNELEVSFACAPPRDRD